MRDDFRNQLLPHIYEFWNKLLFRYIGKTGDKINSSKNRIASSKKPEGKEGKVNER